MPNLETYGLPADVVDQLSKKLLENFELLATEHNNPVAAKFRDEMVVTLVHSTVRNLKGRRQPFLRIVHSPQSAKDTQLLLEVVKGLGYDVEHAGLIGFHPKK